MFTGFKNMITDGLIAVLNLFPSSPFDVLQDMTANSQVYEWLQVLNWFVPVGTFVAILEVWLVGIAFYYVWQIVLRWLQVIE